MTEPANPLIERRLRQAGALILVGLLVQLVTIGWNHPLSFLAFLFVGSPITLAGIVVYLYSLATNRA